MHTVQEIEQSLYRLAPKDGAMDWDNVGHLVGDPGGKVFKVMVALDITQDVACEAQEKGCQLIVSHHPIINCKWGPLRAIRADSGQGRLLMTLLRHDVAAICMHTNLDVAMGGVNDCLAETLKIVDPGPLEGGDGLCRVGHLDHPVTMEEFVPFVSKQLDCNGLRYVDSGRPVYRVAVGGGSCGGYAQAVLEMGCDTFVTADLGYHAFLDAKEMGLNLVDAGHFPTEDPVCEKLISYLKAQFPDLTVLKSQIHREAIHYYVKGE